jgi:hypothetical protein
MERCRSGARVCVVEPPMRGRRDGRLNSSTIYSSWKFLAWDLSYFGHSIITFFYPSLSLVSAALESY